MSSRRLAAVVAHPDDDTFGCAGTPAPAVIPAPPAPPAPPMPAPPAPPTTK